MTEAYTPTNNIKMEITKKKLLLKDLDEIKANIVYNKAYQAFLKDECCADLSYMENLLIQTKYTINSRTGLPQTSYRYRMDLRESKDNQNVELEDGTVVVVSKSKLLSNRKFFNDIVKHYKKLNSYIKIYEDRRRPGIWWMQFSLNNY